MAWNYRLEEAPRDAWLDGLGRIPEFTEPYEKKVYLPSADTPGYRAGEWLAKDSRRGVPYPLNNSRWELIAWQEPEP